MAVDRDAIDFIAQLRAQKALEEANKVVPLNQQFRVPSQDVTSALEMPQEIASNVSKLDDYRPANAAYGKDIAEKYMKKAAEQGSQMEHLGGWSDKERTLEQALKEGAAAKEPRMLGLLNMLGKVATVAQGAEAAGKALKGDYKGAGLQAADAASYLIPGVGEARGLYDLGMGELGTTPESEAIENPQSEAFKQLRQKLGK